MAEYPAALKRKISSRLFTLIVDERPDIVLLDWMLPGGSGMELIASPEAW